MAETKAEELARLLREIEGTEQSMWFDTALLGLETLSIGIFGTGAGTSKSALSATKAAKPTQAQKAALAVKGQQNLTQEIIDLAPPDPAELERLQSLYRYTPEERLLDVAGNELLHYEKMFRGASDELIDYARQYNKEYLVSKIPKMEAEMYAPFQKGYLEYAMNLPKGSLPVDLKTFANREIDRLEKLILDQRFQEMLEPNALPADASSPYALAEAGIPFTPKKRAPEPGAWPSKPWHMETQINQSQSRQLEPFKVASQGEINLAKKQAMIKDSLRRLERQRSLLDEIKSDPDKFIGEDGYINTGRIALDFDLFDDLEESSKALRIDPRGQELFENRRLAIVEMRKHQSPEMIKENLYEFNTTTLKDDMFMQDVHEKVADDAWMNLKGELQRKGYSDELVDSIVGRKQAVQMDKRNIDFWKEISNELMYSRSLQDFDPSYLGDLKKGDMPDIMQGYLTGNLDDRVQDIMTDASYKKLRDKAIETEHVPMDKARRYPEPEIIINEIMTRQHRAHDAGLMNALKNYGQARARFMYSFIPVVPTAESLYSGYQKKEDLMGKAEELKKGMTPEEIKEAEERLIDIKGTRKYLGPDPVSIPGSSMVRAEYPALPERPVTSDTFGQLPEGEEMSVIEFIKGIPEYNEEDDIMYQSLKTKKKR